MVTLAAGDLLGQEGGAQRADALSVFPTPDARMPGPWLLLAMALTLTLTHGVPEGRAQVEVVQQEAATAAEHPGLDDLLRQAERLLLLREDLQRLGGVQGNPESGERPVCVWRPRKRRTRRALGKTQSRGERAIWSSILLLRNFQEPHPPHI